MILFAGASGDDLINIISKMHGQVIPAESYMALTDTGDRLRAIAILQGKAKRLEAEIEEHRKVQEALQRREVELQKALATRDAFLSVAAHELKTPITSLRAFAQLLLRDARHNQEIAPDRLQFALDAIEVQTGILEQLVVRLLDAAEIETGKLRIEPVRADLVALVRAALATHAVRAQHRLRYEGPDHLEVTVDPVRFEHVITHLLENAIKFSPLGSSVTIGLGYAANGDIELSIADQGVGVPPEQREAIFGRFHQAHGEHHLSGLGLGLYITREIVESHGGSVHIEEPVEKGSRLVLTLPPLADQAPP
jgi:signal transduction histidine kinase